MSKLHTHIDAAHGLRLRVLCPETPETFLYRDATDLLDSTLAFVEPHNPPVTPFIHLSPYRSERLLEAFKQRKELTYEVRGQRSYIVQFFTTQTCVICIKDENQDGMSIIPWVFHLSEKLELNGSSYHIDYSSFGPACLMPIKAGYEAGVTPLPLLPQTDIRSDNNPLVDLEEARSLVSAFQHALLQDIEDAYTAFCEAKPLITDLRDTSLCQSGDAAFPWFLQKGEGVPCISRDEFLQDLMIYIESKTGEAVERINLFGHMVQLDGSLSKAFLTLKMRGHLHDEDTKSCLSDLISRLHPLLQSDNATIPLYSRMIPDIRRAHPSPIQVNNYSSNLTSHDIIQAVANVEAALKIASA